MEKINLFDQIEKLEESSEEISKDSLVQSNQIKEQSKKDLESFIEKLNLEKKLLSEKLAKEFLEEENITKIKNDNDFKEYVKQLELKYETNLKQILLLFEETNLK